MIIVGKTYVSIKGVKFKVLDVNEIDNNIKILFLDTGLESKMKLDDALKYLNKKGERWKMLCGVLCCMVVFSCIYGVCLRFLLDNVKRERGIRCQKKEIEKYLKKGH